MKKKQKVLIVGAGVAGKEVLGQLKKYLKKIYEVVGFVDDDLGKQGKLVKDYKVLGRIDDLKKLIKKYEVSEVFIAIPSAQGESVKKIIDACESEKVLFKIVPRILEIVLGRVKLQQIREVQIEDLLGRPIVRSEQSVFIKQFQGKKVLITGAAGSIGSEICRQIIQFNPKLLIAFDFWESGLFELDRELKFINPDVSQVCIVGNIQDYPKLEDVFLKYKPDVVFHAAAFKHVPLMQRNPLEAVKNNIFGTDNVARAAKKALVSKFINISTDKAADPESVMGTTKMIAEKVVLGHNKKSQTKFSSVRFGNVLDSHGSVVPIFRKQILAGGPVTVTDPKMTRFLMTIPEAVQLVLQASLIGKGGEIFVLEMGKPVRIVDLAKLMIRLAGFTETEIPIRYIGIRPGEKLAEKLNTDLEKLEKTENEKVYQIKENGEMDLAELFKSLKEAVLNNKNEKIYNILKKIAPNLQKIL